MKRLLHIIFSLTLLSGCSLDIPYENQFSDPEAIASPQTARELLASAYAALPNPEYDLSILTDDFMPTYWASVNPSLLNQYNWQPQAIEDLSTTTWREYYAVIATLNALIERAALIEDSPAIRRIQGEAYTLKAYCYFQLLRFYGPGPENPDADAIVLKEKLAMANLRRSSVSRTVEEIETLLRQALPLLEHDGESTDWLGEDAARILLAKTLLYSGRYTEAAAEAKSVLDARGYDAFIPDAYRSLWEGQTCPERIFALNYPTAAQGYYLGIVYDTTGGDYFIINPQVAATFAGADCRTDAAILTVTFPSLGKQDCFGKYNAMRKKQREITLINKLRLSDALFAYAEASSLAGSETDALTALNLYLARRGADALPQSLSAKELLEAILQEKHKEFIGEGERFFDLKFYRNSALGSFRIKPNDYRWNWPVPREEYLYNDQMTQNDKWTITNFN